MIETNFMKLYEKLSHLTEGWHKVDSWGQPVRLWFSDSPSTFRSFMSNISTSGTTGLRLVVAPDFYLAADAADLDHYSMTEAAEKELYLEVPVRNEQTTCGIPKCHDFESSNFEIENLKSEAEEHPDDEDFAMYLDYDAEADYTGSLVADYGTFELHLYGFKSRTCPEYKPKYAKVTYFEDSETYRVLKPLLKRIYIYGKDS